MKKEKVKFNFLGFNYEAENPTTKGVIILGLLLAFVIIIASR